MCRRAETDKGQYLLDLHQRTTRERVQDFRWRWNSLHGVYVMCLLIAWRIRTALLSSAGSPEQLTEAKKPASLGPLLVNQALCLHLNVERQVRRRKLSLLKSLVWPDQELIPVLPLCELWYRHWFMFLLYELTNHWCINCYGQQIIYKKKTGLLYICLTISPIIYILHNNAIMLS